MRPLVYIRCRVSRQIFSRKGRIGICFEDPHGRHDTYVSIKRFFDLSLAVASGLVFPVGIWLGVDSLVRLHGLGNLGKLPRQVVSIQSTDIG